MQSLKAAVHGRLGEKHFPKIGMVSFTEVQSVASRGHDLQIWLLHQASPEQHEHEVLVFREVGDEDPDQGELDEAKPEIRRASAVQRRFKIECRYFAANRTLAVSAPSEIAQRIVRDLIDAGLLIAKPVEIDLRKLEAHPNIKDIIAAWADGSGTIRTRAAFGSKVLGDRGNLKGDLRSIRVLVDLGHAVRGAMISRDGRLTVLGNDGNLEVLVRLFDQLRPLIGQPPPSQSAL